jgi:hypothetical protein
MELHEQIKLQRMYDMGAFKQQPKEEKPQPAPKSVKAVKRAK